MTTFRLEIDVGADVLEPGARAMSDSSQLIKRVLSCLSADCSYTNLNVDNLGHIVTGCSDFGYIFLFMKNIDLTQEVNTARYLCCLCCCAISC